MLTEIPLRSTMRRVGLPAVALVLVLGLAAEPAYAQRGNGRMQGSVKDPEGNGLGEVTITAFNPDVSPSTLEGSTNDGGRWSMLGFARGAWKFTFVKEGYISYEVDVSVSAANRNPDLEITLNPIPEGAGAAGPGAGAESPELFSEGNTLFEAGDYAGAAAKWSEFSALNPDLHQVHGNLGNAYRELGDVAKAQASYEALLAVEPDNTMANYNLGEMLVEAGDIDAALPYFEAVLENSPDDPAVYYNVAELYSSRGEMAAAIPYYTRALEVDPNYLPAQMQIGFAYVNSGDIPAAIAAFEKYIEIAPPDDPELALVKDVLAALRSM